MPDGATPLINIDHHPTNFWRGESDRRRVGYMASSIMAEQLGGARSPDRDVPAHGLFTDTGSFMHIIDLLLFTARRTPATWRRFDGIVSTPMAARRSTLRLKEV